MMFEPHVLLGEERHVMRRVLKPAPDSHASHVMWMVLKPAPAPYSSAASLFTSLDLYLKGAQVRFKELFDHYDRTRKGYLSFSVRFVLFEHQSHCMPCFHPGHPDSCVFAD